MVYARDILRDPGHSDPSCSVDSGRSTRYKISMSNNTRHLTGIIECLCRTCAPSGGNWRRYVKRDTRRFLRHTAEKQIQNEINEYNNHDGDASFIVYQSQLTIANARNLRSVDYNF